jgi:hypothetical protein
VLQVHEGRWDRGEGEVKEEEMKNMIRDGNLQEGIDGEIRESEVQPREVSAGRIKNMPLKKKETWFESTKGLKKETVY